MGCIKQLYSNINVMAEIITIYDRCIMYNQNESTIRLLIEHEMLQNYWLNFRISNDRRLITMADQ